MAERDLRYRISATGGDKVKADLAGIGSAGERAFRAVGGAATSASVSMATFAKGFIAFEVMDGVMRMPINALKAAAAYEQMGMRIEFMTGSQAAANKEMARAAEMADRMAFSERQLLDLRSRLVPFETEGLLSSTSSLALTTGLINGVKALGVTAEQTEYMLYGLAQALSAPTTNMEDLRQVVDPMPGLMFKLQNALKQMTGDGALNLRDFVAQGRLTREMFAEALVKAFEDFEGAGERSADTLQGRFTALGNAWDRLMRTIGDTALARAGIDALTEGVNGLDEAINRVDPYAKSLGQNLADAQARVATLAALQSDPLDPGGYGDARWMAGNPSYTEDQRAEQRRRVMAAEMENLNRLMMQRRREAQNALRAHDDEQRRQEEGRARAAQEAADKMWGESPAGRQERALADLTRREREFQQAMAAGLHAPERAAALTASLAEERRKLAQASDPKPERDRAAELQAEIAHLQRMEAALSIRDAQARRAAEIAELSEEAARRSGSEPGSDGHARIRAAEADRLRTQDRMAALERGRREAAQAAERAQADAEAAAEKALRDRESALERIAQQEHEAGQAAKEAGIARMAAADAAAASSREAMLGIEAQAKAERDALAVAEAGRKAYEALEEGAADDERDAARIRAEGAELARQQARADSDRLRISDSLLAAQERAADAHARASAASSAARAMAAAESRAETAAIRERTEAQVRGLETERRAMEARLALGAEATGPERDRAEALARTLAAQEDSLRRANLEIDRAETLAEARERAALAAERGAVADRLRADAVKAGSVIELEAWRKRAEGEERQIQRAEAIRAARARLGAGADPGLAAEAERLAAQEWDRTDAIRQANEDLQKRHRVLTFEAALTQRVADAETRLSAFRTASGPAAARLRAAEQEAEVQDAIRRAQEQQLGLSDAQVRAQVQQAQAAQRILDVEVLRTQNAETFAREAQRIADLTAATMRGPEALREAQFWQAGQAAAYANPDDPAAAGRAVTLARLQEGMDLAARAQAALTAANDRYGESARRIAQADAEYLRLAPYIVGAARSQEEAERALAQARIEALAQVSPLYAQVRDTASAVLAADPHQRLADFWARETETRRAIEEALIAQGVAHEALGVKGEAVWLRLQAGAAGFGDVASSVSQSLQGEVSSLIFSFDSLGDSIRSAALALSKMAFDKLSSPLFDGLGTAASNWLGSFSLAAANGAVFDMSNVVPFAKGDVFTSPRFFQYGGGQTGVMGEAGPEAIMPLRRGADGKLGVAASGGGREPDRVEVHIHNPGPNTTATIRRYPASTQQASAAVAAASARARRNA